MILNSTIPDQSTNLNYSSYECLITQTYIDCLLESNYKTCKEAVKLEMTMLSMLAYRNGTQCLLNTAKPKKRVEADEKDEGLEKSPS
ncbi:unnamed protein product [Nippostrongylus brasiliensis]|uniref:Uncharacterized protein n=1 Tax=Nippostrongylus brasiliensis TaxID=27835 RepID=A0A0N4YE20_NIPBR|nr:unnamed protein product [Nippostrongylus brasiliensis]